MNLSATSHYYRRAIKQALSLLVVILALSSCESLRAESSSGAPEDVPLIEGMSVERLERVRTMMRSHVDNGVTPNAVAIVSRNGRIGFNEAYGEMGPDESIEPDAIMRMASIGKTITAVAIMILYEDGVLTPNTPVAAFLSEFADAKVSGSDGAPVSLNRPVLVQDLLTHSAGLAVSGAEVDALWDLPNEHEFARGIAALPLRAQPGQTFRYGNAYEPLAAIVEEASGMPFDIFLQKRIFEPLNLEDMYFHVPDEKLNRLSAIYTRDENGQLTTFRERGQEERPAEFTAGGGGLRGTVPDFHRFAMMLLNGGELDGQRILSPKTVQLMMKDHVGEEISGAWPGDWGWGFGAQVRRRVRDNGVGTAGAFGWNGGTGTWYFVDPSEKLVGVIFTQIQPGNPNQLRPVFETGVYHAISESYSK